MDTWIKTTDRIPDEGVTVETKIDGPKGVRNEQKLKRHRGLWFYPDLSAYIYYNPTHWRKVGPKNARKTRILESPWVVVFRYKDDPSSVAIHTIDGEVAVSSSEWMQADRGTLEHIVELHNKALA